MSFECVECKSVGSGRLLKLCSCFSLEKCFHNWNMIFLFLVAVWKFVINREKYGRNVTPGGHRERAMKWTEVSRENREGREVCLSIGTPDQKKLIWILVEGGDELPALSFIIEDLLVWDWHQGEATCEALSEHTDAANDLWSHMIIVAIFIFNYIWHHRRGWWQLTALASLSPLSLSRFNSLSFNIAVH